MQGKLVITVLFLLSAVTSKAMVVHNGEGFFVRDHDTLHKVKHHDVDPFLRGLSTKQLMRYAEVGNRIRTAKLSNGDYTIKPHGELKGGGPILGCLTAVVGYTAVGVAALATLVVTAPVDPLGAVGKATGVAVSGTGMVTAAVVVATEAPTP